MENKGGRPTKYNPEYHPAEVMKYCLAGLIDTQIAQLFEISVSTFYEWKNEYIEFSEAIKKGKEEADCKVASMLFRKAVGFKEKRQVPFKVKKTINGEGSEEKIEIVEVEDYYPPETSAQIFWLKNRQPQTWRDKQNVEIEETGSINISDWLKINNQNADTDTESL